MCKCKGIRPFTDGLIIRWSQVQNPGGPTRFQRSNPKPPRSSLTYGRARLTRVLFAALRARPLLPQTEKIAPWTLSRVGVGNPNPQLRHIVSITYDAFMGRLPPSTSALAATSALGYGLYHQAVWPGASRGTPRSF